MSDQNNSSKDPRDFKVVLLYVVAFGFFMYKALMSTPNCNGGAATGAVDTGMRDSVVVCDTVDVAAADCTLEF